MPRRTYHWGRKRDGMRRHAGAPHRAADNGGPFTVKSSYCLRLKTFPLRKISPSWYVGGGAGENKCSSAASVAATPRDSLPRDFCLPKTSARRISPWSTTLRPAPHLSELIPPREPIDSPRAYYFCMPAAAPMKTVCFFKYRRIPRTSVHRSPALAFSQSRECSGGLLATKGSTGIACAGKWDQR